MTIYFNSIGNNGHLGNQMFQLSALMGMASIHNYDWAIPPQFIFGDYYPLRSNIYDCFTLPLVENHVRVDFNATVVNENIFKYDQNFVNNLQDGVCINGYFQSEKYFYHIKDDIKSNFTFKDSIVEQAEDLKNFVAVHVRRTDYLLHSLNHTNLGSDYYNDALDIVGRDNVVVFSDDIEWCRQQDMFKDFNFSQGSVYSDLYLMTKAKRIVTANSSLSWWAGWLGENDTVVAPREWFGPALMHQDTSDLYPEGWIIV